MCKIFCLFCLLLVVSCKDDPVSIEDEKVVELINEFDYPLNENFNWSYEVNSMDNNGNPSNQKLGSYTLSVVGSEYIENLLAYKIIEDSKQYETESYFRTDSSGLYIKSDYIHLDEEGSLAIKLPWQKILNVNDKEWEIIDFTYDDEFYYSVKGTGKRLNDISVNYNGKQHRALVFENTNIIINRYTILNQVFEQEIKRKKELIFINGIGIYSIREYGIENDESDNRIETLVNHNIK